MSVVGAWTVVWRESRYLPLVLEQLECVPGPVVIVHCDRPFFWTADSPEPSGHASKVSAILADWPYLSRFAEVVKQVEHVSTEDVLRNYATRRLRELGADVAQWVDSDFLMDMLDFERLVATMAADEPRCWTVRARHYWRNWQTLYSKGNFRMGYPTEAVWLDDGSFDRRFEETAKHCDVVVHHPSYALSDQEVHDKVHAFYHAPLFKTQRFWEKWLSGEADKEQKLEPADLPIPDGLQRRLETWNCLEGL